MVIKKEVIDKELLHKNFRVAIFGSARMNKRDYNYKMVYKLSKMIGAAGIDVVTGSGPGIMKAANSGLLDGRKDDNVNSIGLSVKLVDQEKPNRNVDVLYNFDHFSNRLEEFVLLSNIFVVAPGGIGTLLELSYVWQLVQVKKICKSKIILIGDFWPDFIKWARKNPLEKKYFNKSDLNILIPVKDEIEAFKIVEKEHKKYIRLGDKYCRNSQLYLGDQKDKTI